MTVMGAVQTGVLWPWALLESVVSSVEKTAELRLSSLTDCLSVGPGKGTLLVALCTSLVLGGTSLVLGGTSLVLGGTSLVLGGTSLVLGGSLLVLWGTLLAFGGTSPACGATSPVFEGASSVFGGTSAVFGGISLGERGSDELVVITENGLAPLRSGTSGLCGGASDSLFKGDTFFWFLL